MQNIVDSPHILIVDDDPIVRRMLKAYLAKENYQVSELENGADLMNFLQENSVDLILLDVNMPGPDGFTLAQQVRQHTKVGIILVTQRDDDVDKILGLEVGADDYITKPFNPRELSARIKALIRRCQAPLEDKAEASENADLISFDGWQFDLNRRCLISPKQERINLTQGEYQILYTLVHKAGSVQSRDKLATMLNPQRPDTTFRSVDVLIGRLRKKLGEESKSPNLIVTVHGSGYLFAGSPQNPI